MGVGIWRRIEQGRYARWMYFKAELFLIIGIVSATLLLLESPTLRTAVLLLGVIWSFCRAYYFAFYVIERYVDSSYRFSGLFSFFTYLLSQRRRGASRSDANNSRADH